VRDNKDIRDVQVDSQSTLFTYKDPLSKAGLPDAKKDIFHHPELSEAYSKTLEEYSSLSKAELTIHIPDSIQITKVNSPLDFILEKNDSQ
jgi:hypothetical protein